MTIISKEPVRTPEQFIPIMGEARPLEAASPLGDNGSFRMLFQSKVLAVFEIPPQFRTLRKGNNLYKRHYLPWTLFAIKKDKGKWGRLLYVKQRLEPIAKRSDVVYGVLMPHYTRNYELSEFCLYGDYDTETPEQLRPTDIGDFMQYFWNSTFFGGSHLQNTAAASKTYVEKALRGDTTTNMTFDQWIAKLVPGRGEHQLPE